MPEKNTFEAFNLNRQLLNAIADLGYQEPTDIQVRAIPLIFGGTEVIGIAQTGTGKTAAYLLPLLMKIKYAQEKEPRALILAPTKELVVQIASHARDLAKYTDLRILALYGGIGPKTQIEELEKGTDILVATPGRFMELYLRSEIVVKKIKHLVIDEADRMMDMGFMPQLRKVFEVIPVKRQNLLFSATFSERVERLSAEFLEDPMKIEITPQATPADQVMQYLTETPNLKTKIHLLKYLLEQPEFERVMIFTRKKETADQVGKYVDRLYPDKVRIVHSNKGQNSRINAVNEFREGGVQFLVTTDVTSRGIDIAEVSHVINFDVPQHYEDYVHRIGRTGRAFRTGTAITFVNEAEEFHIAGIEKLIRQRIERRPIPATVKVEETPFAERQTMKREIDRQRRLTDPNFKGAFHEKKINREKK